MKVVKCKRCGREFEVEKATGFKYCKDCLIEIKKERQSRQNKSDFQKRQEKLLEGVEGVDYIIDLWNGYATKLINGKWMEVHHPGKTIEDYKREFPNAPLVCSSTSNKISDNTKSFMNTPEMKKYFSEKISGDKNPNARCNTTEEQRKSISPFSKSFKGYVGMTDEEINNHIAGCIKLDKVGRTTNQIEYWTTRGYSLEDAKELVSERQRTFTLEKCIDKYGLEEGYRKWKERQEKWSNKIEEQYNNGLFSKVPHSVNTSMYSNIEKEFVDGILNCDKIDYSNIKCYKTSQIELTNNQLDRCSNRRFLYDVALGNKIIEFNGDFWHMNPQKYEFDYYNKISKIYAKDKWEIDSIKIKCAESYGYKVLTIWESEYNKDKVGTIQKCIDFLLN